MGCIFEYDKEHPLGLGIRFKEEDRVNFTSGSFYSKTRAMIIYLNFLFHFIYKIGLILFTLLHYFDQITNYFFAYTRTTLFRDSGSNYIKMLKKINNTQNMYKKCALNMYKC